MLLQGRGLRRLFRLPSVKKAENCLRHRAGYAVQQRMMLLGTGLETGFRLFGGVFACTVVRLIGDAQQVLCVVAEKAGCPAAGALDGRWQKVLQRKQLALIVCRAEHFYRRHLPVRQSDTSPTHLDGGPAGTLQRALCGERIIAPHERLQNHFTTSQSVKSITPCTICARKNIGWMFSKSE